MHLEIVTPEQVLFSGEVDQVSVPGINGEFQMLNNHAPVVSVLKKGGIKLAGNVELSEKAKALFNEENGKKVFPIDGGVVELSNNKVIVLVD